jgi:glycosyltransferase involved in cell wall biosynthesis
MLFLPHANIVSPNIFIGYLSVTNYSDVAVIIPCMNEEIAIAKVVKDFKAALPGCVVHVYDNNSTDKTAEVAEKAGAIIGFEPRPGKGNVVRRMFSEIDSEIYLMIDGDDTYDPEAAPEIVEAVRNRMDMVVGVRSGALEKHQRSGHAFGNSMFNVLYNASLGQDFSDIFSGYRGFSKRFVKSFPALSQGFEIETELSAHASQLRLPVKEIPTRYSTRAEGSESKLSTFKDGARILKTIIVLMKEYKPLYFFSFIGLIGILIAVMVFIPVFLDYLENPEVSLIPTAVLSTGIVLIAMLSFTAGVILDSIRRFRAEVKRMFYNIT